MYRQYVHSVNLIAREKDKDNKEVCVHRRDEKSVEFSVDEKTRKNYEFHRVLSPSIGISDTGSQLGVWTEEGVFYVLYSIGKYYPIVLDIIDLSRPKGLLIHTIRNLIEKQPPDSLGGIKIRVSCFTFMNSSLIDILQASDSHALYNSSLRYSSFTVESYTNIPLVIKDALSHMLSSLSINPSSIYYYLTIQTGQAQFRYLLVDYYQPYIKRNNTVSLCADLSTLIDSTGYDRAFREDEEARKDEYTSFLQHMVTDTRVSMNVVTHVPIHAAYRSDIPLYIHLSNTFHRIHLIYSSYTSSIIRRQLYSNGGERPSQSQKEERKSPEGRGKSFQEEKKEKIEDQAKEEEPVIKRLRKEMGGIEEEERIRILGRIEESIQVYEERIKYKDDLIDMQNRTLKQLVELSAIKKETYSSSFDELKEHVKSLDSDIKYMKHLIKCISEYRSVKDDQWRSKLLTAISSLTKIFDHTIITGLTNLLTNK